MWGKIILGRGTSRCKGPGAAMCLMSGRPAPGGQERARQGGERLSGSHSLPDFFYIRHLYALVSSGPLKVQILCQETCELTTIL